MLTVADIVGTEALRLTLRGGLAGSERPVRWVHISELADPTPWLRGGELLLTTGDARDRLELWLALRAHELQARRELEPVL